MNDISLTSVGFHCAGSCWAARGGTEGLFRWLEEDLKLRDWFVTAAWTEEEPQVLLLPPLTSIHPIQDYLVSEAVRRYQLEPELVSMLGQEPWEQYPTLFTWLGKTFIFQGTHRLAAAALSDSKTYRGYHVGL